MMAINIKTLSINQYQFCRLKPSTAMMELKEARRIESLSSRKWEEDMCMDCLVKIFERVGLESLMFNIPFVCKSWYKASLDPICWKVLDFQFMYINEEEEEEEDGSGKSSLIEKWRWPLSSIQFIKVAVHRNGGMATQVLFPKYHYHCLHHILSDYLFNANTLEHVLERCPALKTLILPDFRSYLAAKETNECFLKMISKLKNLESLTTFSTACYFREILDKIHIHCPNFQSLTVQAYISENIASAIVTLFPNIKHLVISDTFIDRDTLIIILSGCTKLELLHVTNCKGFDADDAMIMKLASHIKIFKLQSSGVCEDDDFFAFGSDDDSEDFAFGSEDEYDNQDHDGSHHNRQEHNGCDSHDGSHHNRQEHNGSDSDSDSDSDSYLGL
ncbi:hypothetical protein AQUCO_00500040v1 [Aquilegia coerulea]|uniref:F-box domain-containing protein n=1 Tax=Aquilegia coerulea TaxID=218851 RepID=A0A2G5EQ21_AQUCA|nr:hypothetical protein AQUCO_00500040v1 [Aquilegia coerulea]PIA57845.1 hypothetical protein AQUCO_00500040v1 [Aquilegia coerulea]PIA57846.1 hypothetical protein AQUCO_00500040v1 [Aquilegia coerulea]